MPPRSITHNDPPPAGVTTLRIFVATTLLLTCADHVTTYLCLHAPIEGWIVGEANPVAEYMFARVGLGPGLAIDTLLTLTGVFFLAKTQLFGLRYRVATLAVIAASTGFAVVNNIGAISRMGLLPWSLTA